MTDTHRGRVHRMDHRSSGRSRSRSGWHFSGALSWASSRSTPARPWKTWTPCFEPSWGIAFRHGTMPSSLSIEWPRSSRASRPR